MPIFTSLSSFAWLALSSFSAHIAYPGKHNVAIQRPSSILDSQNDLATCSIPKEVRVQAKVPSPFTPLSYEELEDIKQWLYNPERNLNLTSTVNKDLTQTDNYIWIIESLYPNKTNVLPYLDGHSPMPDRFARVVINEGGKPIPEVTEYFVGPLPVSSKTSIKTLDYFYTRSARVPFNARVLDQPRFDAIDEAVAKIMSSIADITLNLTGLQYFGKHNPRTNTEYYPASKSPTSIDGTSAYLWTNWCRRGLASYDKPSDLYVKFNITGSDSSLYNCEMIVYNLVVYTSVDDFRKAFESGSIDRSPLPSPDDSFLKKDRRGPVRDLENRFAPTGIDLGGKRYKIDDANRYIEYLGWSFYTRFTRDVGIQFFDVKFKGERIMYELSLQDAIAQYAGNNPQRAGTGYADRFYSLGAAVTRPIPGYDCPYRATYWDAIYTDGEKVVNKAKTLCIFESDMGHPLTRHHDENFQQSTKGSKLTVRQLSTVGNYDYMFDYTFFVDGTIGVDARASGYLQANYYRPDEEGKWGPRIEEMLAGSLHTHVMNFKADFDLVDSANTFQKTDIVLENITQPWFPELGTFEQMRYNFTEFQTEDDGLLNPSKNGQSMYAIINKNRTNKWGQPQGYRIIPGHSNIALASHNNPFFLKNGQPFKQIFAVTRHHDTEPSSSAALNNNLPAAPLVEFYKFFDGESLVQEDLALWFNLGMHHFTRAEDIPNTLMNQAHSSILFSPQNWGDHEATTDLTNAVIYNKVPSQDENEVTMPETNGVDPPLCFPLGRDDGLVGVF